MTTTGLPPTAPLSAAEKSRPTWGCCLSTLKNSPDTSCTLPRAGALSPSGRSCMPATLVAAHSSTPRAAIVSRSWSKVGPEKISLDCSCGLLTCARYSCCGSGTGSVRSTTALISEKTAVAPPMPSPSERTAVRATPGLRTSSLAPYRMSLKNSLTMVMLQLRLRFVVYSLRFAVAVRDLLTANRRLPTANCSLRPKRPDRIDRRGSTRGAPRGHAGGRRQQDGDKRIRKWVRGAHLEQQPREQARGQESCRGSGHHACRRETQRLRQHQAYDRRWMRAKRDADADFPRALPDHERHHTVDADRCEHEREQREAAEQLRREPALCRRVPHDLVHRAHAIRRLIPVDGADFGGQRRFEGPRLRVGFQDERQREVAHLEQRPVHRGTRLVLGTLVADVLDDADD